MAGLRWIPGRGCWDKGLNQESQPSLHLLPSHISKEARYNPEGSCLGLQEFPPPLAIRCVQAGCPNLLCPQAHTQGPY